MLHGKFGASLIAGFALACVAGIVFDVLSRDTNFQLWMVSLLVLLLSGMVLIVLGQK